MYQRTPPWILPKYDPPSGARMRWALRRLPMLRRALRIWTYWSHKSRAVGFMLFPRLMRAVERRARSHAKRQLKDQAVRTVMTPDYQAGCKRILLSNDFLPTLNRPNVTVETNPILRVTRDSVVTADGCARACDVLILATGFNATDPLGDVRIAGRDGLTLADAWRGGMQARLGLAVSGFPNLFLLGGPNTGLGHNSIVFMLEAQIDHILRCLRSMQRHKAACMEVRAKSQARFNALLQRWMARTVWLSGCRSWYLDRSGRNTTLWPGFSFGYWLRTWPVSSAIYHYRKTPSPAASGKASAAPAVSGSASKAPADSGDPTAAPIPLEAVPVLPAGLPPAGLPPAGLPHVARGDRKRGSISAR